VEEAVAKVASSLLALARTEEARVAALGTAMNIEHVASSS